MPWDGKQVLRDVGIRINGYDQSNYVNNVAVEAERDEVDVTAIGDEYRQSWPGNEYLTIDLGMFFGNQLVDQTLREANADGSVVAIEVLPHNDLAATNNPVWQADCIVVHYQVFGADVGEALMSQITLKSTGQYDVVSAEALLPFLPPWAVEVVL